MQYQYLLEMPRSYNICKSISGASISQIPTHNFLMEEGLVNSDSSELNPKLQVLSFFAQLSKLFKGFMMYVQEQLQLFKQHIDEHLNLINHRLLDSKYNSEVRDSTRMVQENQELRFKVQELKFRIADLEGQRSQYTSKLEQMKEEWQMEVKMMKRENYLLNQQNFSLRQRVQCIQLDCKQQLELKEHLIREKYQDSTSHMKKKLKQLQGVIRTKQEVIIELKKVIAQFNIKNIHSALRNTPDTSIIHQARSPGSSKIKGLQLSNTIQKSTSPKPYITSSNRTQNVEATKSRALPDRAIRNRRNLVTQFSQSPFTNLKRRRHPTTSNQVHVECDQKKAKHLEWISPPKSGKINFRVIEEELDGLSHKLQLELDTVNSVRK